MNLREIYPGRMSLGNLKNFVRRSSNVLLSGMSVHDYPSRTVMLKVVRDHLWSAKIGPAGLVLARTNFGRQKWSPSVKFGPPLGPLLAGLIGPGPGGPGGGPILA